MRTAPLPSMVVTGVPLSLSDDDIKEGLIAGSGRTLPALEQNELRRIEVRRLFLRAREQGMPPGRQPGSEARETSRATTSGDSAPQSDSRPTRSVRVFVPPVLLDRFLSEGCVSIRWSVHSCRPYTPTQFYCKTCQRMGTHSTKHHREGPSSKGQRTHD